MGPNDGLAFRNTMPGEREDRVCGGFVCVLCVCVRACLVLSNSVSKCATASIYNNVRLSNKII